MMFLIVAFIFFFKALSQSFGEMLFFFFFCAYLQNGFSEGFPV